MLSVKKTQNPNFLDVELTGSIDQSFNLIEHLGENFKKIKVRLQGVARINSFGCREWLAYFHKLRCDGVKIEFYSIPPAIVSQINFISEFILSDEICSVLAPYYCDGCSTSFSKEYSVRELQFLGDKIIELRCQNCPEHARFDELYDEYFTFLK